MEVNKVLHGDCLEVLKGMEDNSVDSIVTDPPYGLSFMGKKWDYDVPDVEVWKECLRVLKHGGYLLAFAGTRTQHRMAVRIEDAGFEIRDMIAWVYGSGFPKSHNIGKAVDKLQGNEREDLGKSPAERLNKPENDVYEAGIRGKECRITKGQSEWEGWGTALKPALEPITVARKPLSEKTVVENCLKWGTGGINIDGSRIEINPNVDDMLRTVDRKKRETETWENGSGFKNETNSLTGVPSNGRFPANFIHDGSDEVVGLFPNENARFFYCAKASKTERNLGCENLEQKQTVGGGGGIGNYLDDVNSASGKYGSEKAPAKNNHPTVKPIDLMRYLVKLVTPKGGVVLDPYAGSGSTACGAIKEGFDFVIIEREAEYIPIINARIEYFQKEKEVEVEKSIPTQISLDFNNL
jgi:DNA modification methylase